MPRREYQLKIIGIIDRTALLAKGAEPLGQSAHQDIYLSGETTRRIRIDTDEYLYAEKAHDIGAQARVKDVTERVITKREADRMIKEAGELVRVCKDRTFYRLRNTIIAQDEVEHLGKFIEIHSDTEEELADVLRLLGYGQKDAIKTSYLDLMLKEQYPIWKHAVIRLHDKIGELTFGITSGILTTIGVLMGVNSASPSKLPVIASIVAIGISDSLSDAFSMYNTKINERGSSKSAAMRFAMGTWVGKILMPLILLAPILLLPLKVAIVLDLLLAGITLLVLSVEQAVVSEKPIWAVAGRNALLGLVIIVLATVVGKEVTYLEQIASHIAH